MQTNQTTDFSFQMQTIQSVDSEYSDYYGKSPCDWFISAHHPCNSSVSKYVQ